jgi:flagellar biosynthesis protein FlhF
MKVQKFHAGTAREALHQVREELGADAVILSNRRVAGGVELMALAGADMSSLVVDPAHSTKATSAGAAHPASHGSEEPSRPDMKASTMTTVDILVRGIVREIHSMRGALEAQLAALAWNDMGRREPAKGTIMRMLLEAGFSASLVRQLADNLPAGCAQEQGLAWAEAVLARNLHAAATEEIIDGGGIYALVGSTGVGKTTTVAKLAARGVVRHGADRVALLTTDSYRIGGHEQLRIYGRLLGVAVRAVKDTQDLRQTLSELRSKHLVLIDTVGMGQRDRMVAEQVEMLCNGGADVKRILLLNAAGNGEALDDVVRAYRGNGLHGCIITKVDEATGLGVALDTVIRRKLNLHYVADGQKVPEDLHVADPQDLLHRALRPLVETSPFALSDGEFALVMAGRNAMDRGRVPAASPRVMPDALRGAVHA